jgi:hypothetical protein
MVSMDFNADAITAMRYTTVVATDCDNGNTARSETEVYVEAHNSRVCRHVSYSQDHRIDSRCRRYALHKTCVKELLYEVSLL